MIFVQRAKYLVYNWKIRHQVPLEMFDVWGTMMIPVDLYIDIILNHNLLEYPFALYFYKRKILV